MLTEPYVRGRFKSCQRSLQEVQTKVSIKILSLPKVKNCKVTTKLEKVQLESLGIFKKSKLFKKKTRTTIVVRNAGCARSRYTLKFFFNESMN